MKTFRKYIILIACIALASCGKQIPSDIIQPEPMQNVLYDYHIATTLNSDLPYSDTYKKGAYTQYVFDKHHIDKALFDKSLAWYSRHSTFLSEIYKEVDARLASEQEHLRSQIKLREGQISVSMSGDSVDVWQDREMIWLTRSGLLNKVAFSLKADTSFRPKDAMELKADFIFLPSSKKGKAVMSLCMIFRNDSISSLSKVVETAGTHSICLKADSTYDFRNINGFIYYPSDNEASGSVLVNNISLMRYHDKK